MTAFGAVCGMIGLISVSDHNAKAALLWLIAAQILDGVDGPVARRWAVQDSVPRIDGYILDLVIDYVTCVVLPVLFMYEFNLMPQHTSLVLGAFLLFSSALWFSRTDMMTADHWFNGFPAVWNLVMPTLYLAMKGNPQPSVLNQWINLAVCLLLASTQLTNFKFVHPIQVRKFRLMTVTLFTIWLSVMTWLTVLLPGQINTLARVGIVLPGLYQLGLMVWRTFIAPQSSGPSAQRVLLES
jgi:phosphatidylcholine synthase